MKKICKTFLVLCLIFSFIFINSLTILANDVVTEEEESQKSVVENGQLDNVQNSPNSLIQECDSLIGFSNAIHEITKDNYIYGPDPSSKKRYVSNCVSTELEPNFDIDFDTEHVLTIIKYQELYYIQYESEDAAKEAVEVLKQIDGVKYAEVDAIVNFDLPIESKTSNEVFSSISNHFSWGVPAIKADLFADYVAERDNSSITVAVVDTGVDYTHSFLKSKIKNTGYDYVNQKSGAMDDKGHGTHVAGIIADSTQGLNVSILPVKVLDNEGEGSWTDVALGIRYAVDQGASIINLSLSGGHDDQAERAITYAISKGATVVVSAGNDIGDIDTLFDGKGCCPSHIREAIVVSSIDRVNQKAWDSNYGNAVDLAAPGVSVYSCKPGNDWTTMSGTSMAAPHVSAAAAMVKSIFPNATPSEIETVLKNSCTDLGSPGWDIYFGMGLLDLTNLMTDMPFIDVSKKDWFYLGTSYVYSKGIMTGRDKTHFMPAEKLQRQDMILMLYRSAGSPHVNYRPVFSDVTSDHYFKDAAIWAYDNNIMRGSNGKLGVGEYITREDFALVLYRYAKNIGLNVSNSGDLSKYPDGQNVSAYARDAMKWAVGKQIISGNLATNALDPQGKTDRAATATMFMRFLTSYNL